MGYDWDFSGALAVESLMILLQGFSITLLITGTSIVFGSILGFTWGYGAISGSSKSAVWQDPLVYSSQKMDLIGFFRRQLLIRLMDVIRAIPLLLFIFLCYYGIPLSADFVINSWAGPLVGFRWTPSALQTVLIAFTINLAAFIADLVRSAIGSYPLQRMQSGLAVGIGRRTLVRHVVLPDVLREIFAALTNLYITIFKMSTLASGVAVYEILHSGNLLIQRTYRPLEVYLVIALFFVASSLIIVAIEKYIENKSLFKKRT